MPFSPSDAEKHKKGLSAKDQKQWARIAESVRKRELKKGKDEKEAAASAIKQANGVVQVNTSNYSVYKNKQTLDYEPQLVVHQEKAHLVVPVVMMVEGVHNGNLGPVFHSAVELGKYTEAWNGIPVVVYHPEEDGIAISANKPEVIDAVNVGKVYNSRIEDNKLKAEIWFDEDKLNKVSTNTLDDINDSKEIEVSLGMFADYEIEEGEWNGEKYGMIACNYRPDHLAVLPDQIGACSCKDGCGIGANKKKDEDNVNSKDMKKREIMPDDEEDDDEDDLMTDKKCKDKQKTEVNSGGVELNGNSAELVNSLTRGINSNNKKEDKKMANAKDCPKCLEKINALITNTESKFEEADREWLLTQEESVLDKLAPVVKEVEKIVEKTVEVNKLSAEDQAALAFGKRQMKERKDKMIQGIQDNTEKGTWDEVTLNTMTEDMLERVYKSVKKENAPVDFSLNSTRVNTNASADEALYPAGIEIK